MKAVIQRVSRGSVSIDGEVHSDIKKGLVILLGIAPGDTLAVAEQMADKIVHLRIFEDSQDKMNLSLQDVNGEALVVSQFTLYADTSRGRRPSFIGAAQPDHAEPLVAAFTQMLAERGIPTKTGVFGARMEVALVNDGPVTIVMEY